MFDRASEPKEPTLPGFVAWLERKDPNERYEWPKAEICACGQYAKEVMGQSDWIGRDGFSELNMLARGPLELTAWETAPSHNWTFGKLLERCRKKLETA